MTLFEKNRRRERQAPEDMKASLEKRTEEAKRRAVQNIKNAGQTVIDNAEKMLGLYTYQTGELTIEIRMDIETLCIPIITVKQQLIPDQIYATYSQ